MSAFVRALMNSGASDIQEALGLPDITSTEMLNAIDTWFADWFARAPSKELGEDPLPAPALCHREQAVQGNLRRV